MFDLEHMAGLLDFFTHNAMLKVLPDHNMKPGIP